MLELMQSGSTKTFVTNDTTGEIGTSMAIRIIGICQDVKSDGTGQAGLTFQTTHALATCQTMNKHAENTGGWGTSRLEQWANSTFLNSLPNELATNIVNVKKYYNPTWNSTSTDTITSTDDKAFVLSYKEMFNYTNNDHPWYEYEGTGASYNEQYQYYAYNEITANNLKQNR
jgi:hypothetical protein